MSRKIVIVGGVAGGASAAAKARRTDESAQVIMFERGPYISFANCGLPYYVGGQISDREALLLQTPEKFHQRFHVEARCLHEVVRIDRAKKAVEVKDLVSGRTFAEPYDALILAPGAGAIVPPLPGIRADNIFTVKTVPDSDKIKAFLDESQPKRAVVVGAGFIGIETVEALCQRGLEVALVELQQQVLPPFDRDMAAFVGKHLEEKGVEVILGDGIKAFHGGERAKEVELASGRRIPADLVILSIGVRPEIKLAREAELVIGPSGLIRVNEKMETSDPQIYAAGDAVEVVQLVTGKKTRMPLAGPANKQGRVAGANAAGGDFTFRGALGTAIVESLEITAARTGLTETEAQKEGLSFYTSYTHSLDHAGYYPGASLLAIKLVVEKETGRLLGGQIIGEKGVDKRIDVLATALYARLRVDELEELDLAYAPQFSSAKDPVIMAGFVAGNISREEMEIITWDQLEELRRRGGEVQLIDVRTASEHSAAHIPGSRLLPVDSLRENLSDLDPNQETVVYCGVGFRAYLAYKILKGHGFTSVKNLSGGFRTWKTAAE